MATRAQLETALRNADAAGDVDAAKQLATAIRTGQFDDNYQAIAEAAKPSVAQRVGDVFTGNLRETRATREIPSITEGGLPGMRDLPLWKQAALGSALLVSPDENDQISIIKNMLGGDVSVAQDEAGNTILNIGGELRMLNKPGIDYQDASRAGALASAFTPAGRAASAPAGLGAQMAAGAAASGATEAALAAGRSAAGSDKTLTQHAGDVLTSTVFGGVIPLVIRSGQWGSDKLRNVISNAIGNTKKLPPNLPIFNPDGTFNERVIRIVADKGDDAASAGKQIDDAIKGELGRTGVMTPDEIERFNLFARQSVSPTRAQVSQAADDFQFQQEALKRSGPVADRLAQQEGQMVAATERVAKSTAGADMGAADTSVGIYNTVMGKVNAIDERIGQMYQAARDVAPTAKNVRAENLVRVLKENRGENQLSNGLIAAVRTQLKERGIIDRGWSARGTVDVNTAEQIRKVINSYHEGANPNARRIIRALKDALDDDVAAAAGGDVFAEARAARAGLGREIEAMRGSKFANPRPSLVEKIMDESIPQEQVFDRAILSRATRTQDLEQLKKFLTTGTPEQVAAGQQAWRDTARQAVNYMLNEATKTQAKAEGGSAVFNGRLFKQAMMKIGDKKLAVMFDADQLQNLRDIAAIGRLRVPVTGTQQGLGPSAQAIKALSDRIPVIRSIKVLGQEIMNYRGEAQAANPAKTTAQVMENINKMIMNPPRKIPAAAMGAMQAGAQESRYNSQ